MKTLFHIHWLLAAAATAALGDVNGDLIRLYEDEILAHDLYTELARSHPDLMPLRNIPRSESVHRNVMEGVLKARGIAIPNPPDGRKFATEGLDETFNQWLTEGRKSAKDACRVGVRLEEHDIAELRAAAKATPALAATLSNLERASGNHLRAFHRNLTSRDGKYKPEVLKPKDFKAILNADTEPGTKKNAKKGGGCGCDGTNCPATKPASPGCGSST